MVKNTTKYYRLLFTQTPHVAELAVSSVSIGMKDKVWGEKKFQMFSNRC